MTSHEIGNLLGNLIKEERIKTNEILNVINLAFDQRAYLDLGFRSMFDWLTRGYGYSNASAYRRIEAARLLRAVPDAARKLESGEVNLTTLSQAQTFIKAEEKLTGQNWSPIDKAEVIEEIVGKSEKQSEQALFKVFPDAAVKINQERRTTIDENTVRHTMNFNKEMEDDLLRVKEVLSHKFPNSTDAGVIAYALKFLLTKLDPLKRPASAPEAIRVTKASIRRNVLKIANGKCIFKDPVTGKTCGSRHQIQIDHILPKALGGTDEPENLRALCRQHNFLMAERMLGKKLMNRYRVN